MDMMGERSSFTKHPSHPQHHLKLLWRPGHGASIRCDACGVIHRGNSYICTVCQYIINETCAALAPRSPLLTVFHFNISNMLSILTAPPHYLILPSSRATMMEM
ncbi:uncharacterized protein LOC121759369 [Salvia splendens]|uniref:uncharacterized protein LOC121758351 n=1 Tax=Salvia splendens TaxID=180675 RepID=UPI001C273C1E|nr:uncharacterized protein LOC121758351 [Salvia splendens]XP_042010857.1 uncharacterized protein LOC121759369 [Salvia splendens]